jgi:hypothetical protein
MHRPWDSYAPLHVPLLNRRRSGLVLKQSGLQLCPLVIFETLISGRVSGLLHLRHLNCNLMSRKHDRKTYGVGETRRPWGVPHRLCACGFLLAGQLYWHFFRTKGYASACCPMLLLVVVVWCLWIVMMVSCYRLSNAGCMASVNIGGFQFVSALRVLVLKLWVKIQSTT